MGLITQAEANKETERELNIDSNAREILNTNGYIPVELIGEGQTSRVYLVEKRGNGGITRRFAAKVPKKPNEIDTSSICTTINRAKNNDRNELEIGLAKRLPHPSIVKPVEAFPSPDGTIIISDYVRGENLEQYISRRGQIDIELFKRLSPQILGSVKHLHERGMVHRDIKPSNILLSYADERWSTKRVDSAFLTDLQNAAFEADIREQALPTRGGTPYTSIELLNALVTDEFAAASMITDLYALGTTFVTMLTGRKPFPWTIVHDPNGHPINIGGREYKVAIKDEQTGDIIDKISPKAHERVLRKQVLPEIPLQFRNLIYRLLTTDRKKQFKNISEVENYFSKSCEGYGRLLFGDISSGVRLGLSLGLAGAIAIGAFSYIPSCIREENRSGLLNMMDAMRESGHREFSLADLKETERDYLTHILLPRMREIEQRWTKPQEDKMNLEKILNWRMEHAYGIYKLQKRLAGAWMGACYLAGNEELEQFNKEGEKRLWPSFIEDRFFRQIGGNYSGGCENRPSVVSAIGMAKLKFCLGPDTDVADVLASYFAPKDMIDTAKINTGSSGYFPTRTSRGYRTALPEHITRIVDRAVALYKLMDDNGNVHWDRIPNKSPIPDYEAEKLKFLKTD